MGSQTITAYRRGRRSGSWGASGWHWQLHALCCAFSECKFTCTSGQCLYLGSLVCNQQNDCGDNSDEENCLLVTEHPPPGIFSCKSFLPTSRHSAVVCLQMVGGPDPGMWERCCFWLREEVCVVTKAMFSFRIERGYVWESEVPSTLSGLCFVWERLSAAYLRSTDWSQEVIIDSILHTGFREFLEVILSHYFKIILNKEGYIESVFKHVIKTRK